MRVAVDVNGSGIGIVDVQNVGHPDTGDHPATDDLRAYRYKVITRDGGESTGTVEHLRSDGWVRLLFLVLNDIERGGL